MIISKKKFDMAIREAVENAERMRAHAEEQREMRREFYREMDFFKERMNRLECRVADLECGKPGKLASEG